MLRSSSISAACSGEDWLSGAASGISMQRERTVSGNTSGKALNNNRSEFSGGSSSVFRNALAACGCRRSASEIMATFRRPGGARICKACSRLRICSVTMRRDFDSGSAIKTSCARLEKTLFGSMSLTRPTRSAARARLPLPGAPEKR